AVATYFARVCVECLGSYDANVLASKSADTRSKEVANRISFSRFLSAFVVMCKESYNSWSKQCLQVPSSPRGVSYIIYGFPQDPQTSSLNGSIGKTFCITSDNFSMYIPPKNDHELDRM